MSEPHRREKEEEKKQEKDEKEEEKRKGWDEKWRRDRVNAVGWAAILIWGALVLLAEATDYKDHFSWWEGCHNLNKAEPDAIYLSLEGSPNISFCPLIIGRCVERTSGAI